MVAYCSAIWRCRYFWLSLVKVDLRSRYRGSVLGMGWSLLHPLAMTVIFTLVFCRVFGQDPTTYAPYVLTGLACWTFLLTSTIQGCSCFHLGETYIRQYPAPMAIYPMRTVLGAAFHLGLALLVAMGLAAVVLGKFNPLALATLIPSLLLLLLFGWSLATLAGLATVYFRDTKHLSEVAFQVAFYVTPVFYESRLLRDNRLGWVLECNPFLPFLELVRQPILHGVMPDAWIAVKACLVTTLAAGAAMYALSRLEKRLIFHL